MSKGESPRRRGRPKLETSKRLVHLLGVRVNDEQLARYQDAAGAEGMDLLDWCRKHLDAAADKILRPKT